MKKRLVLLVILLLMITTVSAQIDLSFTSPDQEEFAGYFLTLKFSGGSHKEMLSSSSTTLDLADGIYSTEAILDSFDTPTPDYFGTKEFVIGEEKESHFLVFPIGRLEGSVLDNSGNLVPYANLNFNCYSTIVVDFPLQADNTGYFTIPNLPVGSCSVVASFGEAAGKTDFKVEKGLVTEIEIILEKEVVKSSIIWDILLVILILLILAMLIVFFFYVYKKKEYLKNKPKPVIRAKKSAESITKQTKALLKILSGKEKKVVDFLMKSKNHSSQAKIRLNTGIPRTSLSRVLQSLERKKIAEIEKMGKMVSVKLTKFFLGKE